MTQAISAATRASWPELPHTEWADTIETLHLYSQIVGKVRMELTPWINHGWNVPLYVTPQGLTTSLIPIDGQAFEIAFDFVDHQLPIRVSDGRTEVLPLKSKPVADFYSELMERLDGLGIATQIHPTPNEIENPIPFAEDRLHATYDPEHVEALFRALIQADRVMTAFRAQFIGKVSPVHFFWGSFDLAVTRFSGRRAPQHPGGIPHLPDEITREAYSHEVTSCGFWPGSREAPDPLFYAYAYPTPEGFSDAKVEPEAAFWLDDLGEFVLPYEAVRGARLPDESLYSFFASTHGAAADLLGWDREALEWERGFRPLG